MGFNPTITETYQENLRKFIAEIKEDGTEIRTGTPEMTDPVDKTKLYDPEFKKKFVTTELFRKYTGWEHWGLIDEWQRRKQTTCNEFITQCGIRMGVKETVGRFDVADYLASHGLSHCWVPANSGATPNYGDVYRLLGERNDHNDERLNHMAISLQVDGTDWYTVEGGQAGPRSGYDMIRRRTRKWKPDELQGWVNMKAYLSAGESLPYYLGGWWKIEEDPYDTYYYWFGPEGKVVCMTTPPSSPMALPLAGAGLIGSFKIKGWGNAAISWNSADVDEMLSFTGTQKKRDYAAVGKTSQGRKLAGRRVQLADAFDGGNY